MVIASDFYNFIDPGFQNTSAYKLSGTDVAGVTLDQTAEHPTPFVGMRNSEFIAIFTSGRIIGQQVLLPFAYDYPSTDEAAGENSWQAAIVAALKAGRLPQPVHQNPVFKNSIGARLVLPASLVP